MIAAHFAALLLIGQGAIAAGNDRVLYQDAQDYVKIVRQDERSIPNEHPFSIGEEEIISLLSPLTYKKKSFWELAVADVNRYLKGDNWKD